MIKVMLRAAAFINMVAVVEALTIGVLANVEIIVVSVISIVLKFALPPPSYFVDVPSDVAVDLFADALTSAILCVLIRIGNEVLADESAKDFAVLTTTLEVPVTTPVEEFGR